MDKPNHDIANAKIISQLSLCKDPDIKLEPKLEPSPEDSNVVWEELGETLETLKDQIKPKSETIPEFTEETETDYGYRATEQFVPKLETSHVSDGSLEPTRNCLNTSYTCAHCNDTFHSKHVLGIHMSIHDSTMSNITIIEYVSLKCSECDFVGGSKEELVSHTASHDDREYRCVAVHETKHTGDKLYKCPLCKYKCRTRSQLRTHSSRVHHDTKPYGCAHCNYKCKSKNSLIPHIRRHTGEKPYKCQYCNLAFSVPGYLTRHMTTHTKEKPYKCLYCDYACKWKGGLKEHERIHTGEKPYKCRFCNYSCKKSDGIKRHEKLHSSHNPHKCSFCTFTSSSKTTLTVHVVHCHNDMIQHPYKCLQCDFKCKSTTILKKHSAFHNLDVRAGASGGQDSNLRTRKEDSSTQMAHQGCDADKAALQANDLCDYSSGFMGQIEPKIEPPFDDSSDKQQELKDVFETGNGPITPKSENILEDIIIEKTETMVEDGFLECKPKLELLAGTCSQQHSIGVPNDKPYQCAYCIYRAKSRSCLIMHLRIHTDIQLYQCAQCNYSTKTKRYLVRHIKRHTAVKPYKCMICDYVSKYKDVLQRHESTHAGEKPHQCPFCKYVCKFKSAMQSHKRTHTGSKPYQCPFCDYASNYISGLRRHERTHTGEKPYKCLFCDYACIDNSNLRRHELIHTGKKLYNFQGCDYAFKDDASLKSHLRLHADKKLHKCKSCDFTSVHKVRLDKHIARVHGEDMHIDHNYARTKNYEYNSCGTIHDDHTYALKFVDFLEKKKTIEF